MQVPRRTAPDPSSHLWRDMHGHLHVMVDDENPRWLNLATLRRWHNERPTAAQREAREAARLARKNREHG